MLPAAVDLAMKEGCQWSQNWVDQQTPPPCGDFCEETTGVR